MSEIRIFSEMANFSRHMHDAGFAAAVRRDKHESTVYLLRRQRTAVMDSVPRESVFKVQKDFNANLMA